MTLYDIGWWTTMTGIAMALACVALSIWWHKVDDAANAVQEELDGFRTTGNLESFVEWHEKFNRLLARSFIIKRIGINLLYGSTVVTLLGAIMLAIWEKNS